MVVFCSLFNFFLSFFLCLLFSFCSFFCPPPHGSFISRHIKEAYEYFFVVFSVFFVVCFAIIAIFYYYKENIEDYIDVSE